MAEFLTKEKLDQLAQGIEVELPGFISGETIMVRLRRPSLLLLAAEGKIPNSLLAAVEELFEKGDKGKVEFKERGEIFRAVARASLMSPTWQEFEQSGISLTDLQLLYIYNFSQSGVDTLRRFRNKQGAVSVPDRGESVSSSSQ